jgi:hypothetical protein
VVEETVEFMSGRHERQSYKRGLKKRKQEREIVPIPPLGYNLPLIIVSPTPGV